MKTLKTLPILICLLFFLNSGLWSQIEREKPILKDEIEIKTTPVKDQKRSEACWSYAAVSFLESELLRKGFCEIDLSEMYYVRLMYLQRGIDYVRYHGNLNFGYGGQAHDVINQLYDHGVIPQEFYVGNEHNSDMDLSELDSVLINYLQDVIVNKKKKWTEEYLGIVESYLGKVPEKFDFNGNKYNPVEFLNEPQIDPNDYVEITSFNHHPFYKSFALEIPDNWSHNRYFNVPVNDFMSIMENSLRNGYGFVWNGDVLNEGFFYFDNICIAPDKESENLEREITQEYRQEKFDDLIVQDQHLVQMIGLARDEKGKLYFKSKNSWGTADIFFGGYQYMSEQYLKLFTISIMVHKDAIPIEIKEKLKMK